MCLTLWLHLVSGVYCNFCVADLYHHSIIHCCLWQMYPNLLPHLVYVMSHLVSGKFDSYCYHSFCLRPLHLVCTLSHIFSGRFVAKLYCLWSSIPCLCPVTHCLWQIHLTLLLHFVIWGLLYLFRAPSF